MIRLSKPSDREIAALAEPVLSLVDSGRVGTRGLTPRWHRPDPSGPLRSKA